MKHFYLFFCLLFCGLVNGQIINFPDANFKAKLLQANVAFDMFDNVLTLDANNDGNIEVSEVQNVYTLNVSNANISDLTGISNFSGLQFLNCNNNLLTHITINNSISLMSLSANHNLLTSIDLDLSLAVEGVDLSYNNFTSFVIEDGYYAEAFNLSHNQLTSLTLSNVIFTHFFVDYNSLTSIQYVGDISFSGTALVSFTHNQFSQLSFPNTVSFDNSCNLYLGDNLVDNVYFGGLQPGNINYKSTNNTFFDLGNYYMTKDCDPENQGNVTIHHSPNLQQVIFKNGYNHTTITCNEGGDIFQIPALNLMINNCPNLSQVCVDQTEQPYFLAWIEQMGLQSQVQVNSNCTSSVLGTETFALAEQFIISPVPAHNILQIHSEDNLEINAVEIYNNLGQIVQIEIGNKQTINVSRLAKGSYYLKIKTDDSSYSKQFLKE